MKSEARDAGTENDRWTLIRDILFFQCKLIVDGFRDLVLLPVSLIAGLASLLGKGPNQRREFYDLLRLGRRSERWINLFGALDRQAGSGSDNDKPEVTDLDELISRVESFLVDEYRKGGITGKAKQRMDDVLDLLQGARTRRDRGKRIT